MPHSPMASSSTYREMREPISNAPRRSAIPRDLSPAAFDRAETSSCRWRQGSRERTGYESRDAGITGQLLCAKLTSCEADRRVRAPARRASIGAGWCDMRTVLALAMTLGWLTSAHAGNDIGVVVTGEGTALAQLSEHIGNWLSLHGRALVSTPVPPAALDRL